MDQQEHRGLSPSSLALFQGCNRKFYLKKIIKAPIDEDASEDLEAFQCGKAFHKILEDKKHILSGLKYSEVNNVLSDFPLLDKDRYGPLLFAMLDSYKATHKKAKLTAIAFETPIETDEFYGIVDVVLEDKDGWWIGDMKTAQAYREDLAPQLPNHPQLNLYAKHYSQLAEILGLDKDGFMGCRYRLTTKSKLIKKAKESIEEYIQRLRLSVKTMDFILPKQLMRGEDTFLAHQKATAHIAATKEEKDYPPNILNCMQYFRPCEWWSKCHGNTFSNMMAINYISSED